MDPACASGIDTVHLMPLPQANARHTTTEHHA
jgi:hypothetical protein